MLSFFIIINANAAAAINDQKLRIDEFLFLLRERTSNLCLEDSTLHLCSSTKSTYNGNGIHPHPRRMSMVFNAMESLPERHQEQPHSFISCRLYNQKMKD